MKNYKKLNPSFKRETFNKFVNGEIEEVCLVESLPLAGSRDIPLNTKATVYNTHEESQVVALLFKGIGIGYFTMDEVLKYFSPVTEEEPINIVEFKVLNDGFDHDDVKQVIYENSQTAVILKDGTFGIAKCHEEDAFDEKFGYQVAYIRAKEKQLLNLKSEFLF